MTLKISSNKRVTCFWSSNHFRPLITQRGSYNCHKLLQFERVYNSFFRIPDLGYLVCKLVTVLDAPLVCNWNQTKKLSPSKNTADKVLHDFCMIKIALNIFISQNMKKTELLVISQLPFV